MTGKTHRVGGMLCVLGGYTLLEANGMLLGNVSPLVQLAVMYPFAIFGSVMSDYDHHWNSCPNKDLVGLGIHKILHLSSGISDRVDKTTIIGKFLSIFDARHRSWQTHSDLFLIAMFVVSNNLLHSSISSVDIAIVRLIFTGLILGVISHLILDMLTPEGIWFIISVGIRKIFESIGKVSNSKFIRNMSRYGVLPDKISLVPNTSFFRTGGTWESLIRMLMWAVCLFLFLKIILSMSPYSFTFLKS